MTGHKHDTDGHRVTREIRDGNEYVTLRAVHCTCGKLMSEHVVSRRPA